MTLAVIGTLAVALPAQAAEIKPSGWSWTNYGPELMGVSCITPNTCVAVGQGGAVLRSPNTDDVPLAWTMVALEKDDQVPDAPVDLVGVTCSDTSCLAVSEAPTDPDFPSWVYRSTDAGVSWTAVQALPAVGARKTTHAEAITCAPDEATAATRVCYAAGIDGGIWRSANDGQAWKAVPLPATAGATASFDKIACASASDCVAAGGDTTPSSVLIEGTTVTPLKTPIGIDKRFAALACDNPARCIATGGVGKYTLLSISGERWGPVHEFRKKAPLGLVVKALSCPVANSCVGLTGDGLALRTDDLGADGDQNWVRRPVPAIIGALDCVTSSCIGVGKSAAWYASFDLGSGFLRVNEVAKFDVAQCAAALSPTCVAGGKENVGVSRTGGTLWTLPIADHGALNTSAIECTAPSTCLILGMNDALFTNDLNAFRPRFGPVQSAAGSGNQTCVNATLCVAVNDGVVYTTFDGGLTQWTQNAFPHVRPMAGLACIPGQTAPVTCFVPIKDLILIGTMAPDAGGLPHWNWRYTNADADEVISAVACSPAGNQCTAVGKAGMVLTTTPDSVLDWDEQTIPPNVPVDELPLYTSVTCPATGFCMAGGAHGPQSIVASTTNNWADYSYDEIGDIRAAPAISGFGCESINRCIAVGSTVLVGVRNPPIAPSAPSL
jgi:hypothetical protein